MSTLTPTSEWSVQRCQQRQQQATSDKDCLLPPATHRVAAAPFGGPVAVVRDEGSLVVIHGSGATGGRPLVRIFSASGQLQGSFLWEGGRLLAWGWSDQLELVMVDEGGKVGL